MTEHKTKFTSIQISDTVWNDLNKLKCRGETFDEVIRVLLLDKINEEKMLKGDNELVWQEK